ncbi:MAG: hypothetical protein ACM3KR_07405 [Deltaproteobacteria bacterium]
MKRISLVLTLMAVLIFAAGCGSLKGSQSTDVEQGQDNFQQARGGWQNQVVMPEGKLRMEISTLGRIERSESPLTKEQKDKLVPILKEISTKTTIDEKYSSEKIKQIDGILTDAQKNISFKKPDGNINQERKGPGNDTNMNQQKQERQTDPNMRPGRQGPPDGINPNGGGSRDGQGFGGGGNTLKMVCDRVISQLEGKQIEKPQQQKQNSEQSQKSSGEKL